MTTRLVHRSNFLLRKRMLQNVVSEFAFLSSTIRLIMICDLPGELLIQSPLLSSHSVLFLSERDFCCVDRQVQFWWNIFLCVEIWDRNCEPQQTSPESRIIHACLGLFIGRQLSSRANLGTHNPKHLKSRDSSIRRNLRLRENAKSLWNVTTWEITSF